MAKLILYKWYSYISFHLQLYYVSGSVNAKAFFKEISAAYKSFWD